MVRWWWVYGCEVADVYGGDVVVCVWWDRVFRWGSEYMLMIVRQGVIMIVRWWVYTGEFVCGEIEFGCFWSRKDKRSGGEYIWQEDPIKLRLRLVRMSLSDCEGYLKRLLHFQTKDNWSGWLLIVASAFILLIRFCKMCCRIFPCFFVPYSSHFLLYTLTNYCTLFHIMGLFSRSFRSIIKMLFHKPHPYSY